MFFYYGVVAKNIRIRDSLLLFLCTLGKTAQTARGQIRFQKTDYSCHELDFRQFNILQLETELFF